MHENVEAAKSRLGFVHAALGFAALLVVGRDREGVAPGCAQIGKRRIGRRTVRPKGDRDAIAALREDAGDAASQAARGARDQNGALRFAQTRTGDRSKSGTSSSASARRA